jgi:hypothetical protein
MKLSYVPRTACLDETVCMLIAGRHSPLLKNARDEIRVIVDAGTVSPFYNYHVIQAKGDAANWQSLHAGLPMTDTEVEKWIVNHC